MLPLIRAPFVLILLPLVTLLFSIACIFYFIPFHPRSKMDGVIRLWAEVCCFIAGVRVHVDGVENVQNIKSALFVSNHQSLFDIPVLFLAIPQSFRMAAKKELFDIPIFGRVLYKAGFMPLDRKKVESSQKALTEMQERFEDGESFWMAPEGTRFNGDGIGDFKSGAFHLAIKTGEKMVPICIYGTHGILPKNKLLPNTKRLWQDVFVQILPAVETSGLTMAHRFELKNSVREQIVASYFHLKQSSSASLNQMIPE